MRDQKRYPILFLVLVDSFQKVWKEKFITFSPENFSFLSNYNLVHLLWGPCNIQLFILFTPYTLGSSTNYVILGGGGTGLLINEEK